LDTLSKARSNKERGKHLITDDRVKKMMKVTPKRDAMVIPDDPSI
jgi:hypothetical protein